MACRASTQSSSVHVDSCLHLLEPERLRGCAGALCFAMVRFHAAGPVPRLQFPSLWSKDALGSTCPTVVCRTGPGSSCCVQTLLGGGVEDGGVTPAAQMSDEEEVSATPPAFNVQADTEHLHNLIPACHAGMTAPRCVAISFFHVRYRCTELPAAFSGHQLLLHSSDARG